MRFRLGFLSGFATGYYLGAKAGQQRYEEIKRTLDRLRRSETFEAATGKAKEAIDEGVDKAKELIDRRSDTSAAHDTSPDGPASASAPTGLADTTPASSYAPYAAETPGTEG